MIKIFVMLILVTQLGCSTMVGYLVGTAGNLTSDLILRELDKKNEKESKK